MPGTAILLCSHACSKAILELLTMWFLSLLAWKYDATSVFTSEQHFRYGYGYIVLPAGMVFDICMWLFCLFLKN